MGAPRHHHVRMDQTPGFHVVFALAYSGGLGVLVAKDSVSLPMLVMVIMMTYHACKAHQLWAAR